MTRWRLVLVLVLSACEPNATSLGAWLHDDAGRTTADAGHHHDAAIGDAAADAGAAGAQYLEAERGVLSGGFTISDDATASGGRSIAPPTGVSADAEPGTARASYRFGVDATDTYLIWGRIHSPDAEHNRFWFQLDGGAWRKWRLSTGDIWYWDALHEDSHYDQPIQFALTAGEHELVIANCVEGVALDRLYVTAAAAGDVPEPANDTRCNPPHSIQVGDACQPSCGSHLDTTCVADACAGKELLAAYDCAVCCKVVPRP